MWFWLNSTIRNFLDSIIDRIMTTKKNIKINKFLLSKDKFIRKNSTPCLN